ncbi:PH domain-containing protein [Rhodococcus spelaei]|uniref:PH domain-containing protein n=1 Tax=Rhodococcus spelaei TaxID=2546320 RepID=A0A541B4D2_9NOCA|nr:PH domain-containing protein [Rhodococcus spelaei]TQF67171.1 PH domain-containing protein [Rhodococcus spelaei]
MPPRPSSHTADPAEQSIHISKLGLLAVGLLAFGFTFVIFASSWVTSLLWLIPIAVAYWMLRVRTIVDADGLRLRRAFSSRTLSWSEIKGFRFPKRGWAFAELTDGSEVRLPVVTFGRLPQLAAASGGRVTDPYAAADQAARDRREREQADAEQHATAEQPDADRDAN